MLKKLVFHGIAFTYGLVSLGLLAAVAYYRDGALTARSSEEEKKAIAKARDTYWNLNRAPLPGFKHAFATLRNGTKIHYVVKNASGARSKNIAIFVHGYPDSYVMWKNILPSTKLNDYTLIAFDLPGYGGSDSLQKYGPGDVLEALTGFILAMRQQYLQEGGKVILVAHDWGGIVSLRLASEASELADRFIIAGAVIPAQIYTNVSTLAASSLQMIHTWLRNPFNTRLLKSAFATAKPVSSQLKRSYYIFIFQLPTPLAHFAVTFGDFWFANAVTMTHIGKKHPQTLTAQEKGEGLALSGGPSEKECGAEVNGEKYSSSVRARAHDHGMREKIRYYREQLGLGTWEKSIETVVALSEIPVNPARSGSGAGLFEDGPRGALKAPATLIHGKYDAAFEHRLGLNGIGDYMTKGSQALLLNKSAHWSPMDPSGSKVIADIIAWALEGEKGTVKERVGANEHVTFVVDK